MSKAKVFSTSDGGRSVWIEWPGCGYTHAFKLDVPQENGAIWKWNGDTERPTFTPSMLVNAHHESSRCHSFVTDGKIQFLSDCWHPLKGQTVELPDY